MTPPQRPTRDQLTELFARTLQMEVAPGGRIGGRIETQGDLQAVVVRPHTNHRLHLILTVLTGGFWAFMWLPLAVLRGRKKRQFINIDEFGLITIQPADGELAASISNLLGAPQVAGTFVNPKGFTKSTAIGEAGSQIGGGPAEVLAGKVVGAFAGVLAGALTDVAREARAQQDAHDSTPSFGALAYLALTEDEVLVIQADTDMIRWATVGPEIFGRASRSAVASAELDLRRWSSALRIGFADGERWQFEVRRPHRDTAEQVARALGGRVG